MIFFLHINYFFYDNHEVRPQPIAGRIVQRRQSVEVIERSPPQRQILPGNGGDRYDGDDHDDGDDDDDEGIADVNENDE